MIYSVVLVSAIQQCESVILIYIHPFCPSPLPSHLSRSLQSARLDSLVLFSNFPLTVYFTHDSLYIRIGNSNPLQYSCLENSMDRGAWQATIHGVTESWTQLSTVYMCQCCFLSSSHPHVSPLYSQVHSLLGTWVSFF